MRQKNTGWKGHAELTLNSAYARFTAMQEFGAHVSNRVGNKQPLMEPWRATRETSTHKTLLPEVMSATGPFTLTDTLRDPDVQTGGFLKEKSKICLDHSYIEYFRLQSFSARDFP